MADLEANYRRENKKSNQSGPETIDQESHEALLGLFRISPPINGVFTEAERLQIIKEVMKRPSCSD